MDNLHWADKFGPFTAEKNSLTFPGGKTKSQDGAETANVGITFCDKYFGNGKISAEVTFADIDPVLSSIAEIVVYQDLKSGDIVTIGLGGNNYSYSARHYQNGQWKDLGSSGIRDNLVKGQKYALSVEVLGSQFKLSVNGVNVIEGVLPFPIDKSQPGVFVVSPSKVKISDYTVATQKPLCFVLMQYSSPYNELYTKIIKPVCSGEFELNVVRADEIYGPGQIVEDILKSIKEAKIVIAEVSPNNANVYYELGYANALNKNVILIADKNTELPFDIRNTRTLFYENTIDGTDRVKDGLISHLKALATR